MIVSADDGLDEISIASETQVGELKGGKVTTYTISPSDFGIEQYPDCSSLHINSAEESLVMLKQAFANENQPATEIVALNAGAAIYVANLCEDLLAGVDLEERIYRLRCVEAWSMVIPWIGFPLKMLLERFNPLGSAKYVAFTTLYRPEEMPGQRSYFSSIKYPYVEGLRLDEAYHPLAIMAVGMYGQVLPNQNGAPLRLVVPWKYGFKSIKSIVRIELTETRPRTTWNLTASNEYGFYANVNPTVHHPRWSQGSERRLPSSLFNGNRKISTRMYNGYDEVAGLYAGMNLRLNY